MKAFVYLLVCQNMFKIGKAVNIEKRYYQLKRFYSFNLGNSYSIELESENEAYRVEKILHLSFKSFQFKGIDGDGSTEFFDISCLEDVLGMIEYLKKNTNIEIKKGITLQLKAPNPIISEDEKLKRKMDRYKKFPNFISIRHAIRYVYCALKCATDTKEEIGESYKVEIDDNFNEVGKRHYYIAGKCSLFYKEINDHMYSFLTNNVFSKSIRLEKDGKSLGILSIFGDVYLQGKENGKHDIYTELHVEEYIKYFKENEPRTNKEKYVAKYMENFKDIDVGVF